MNGTLAVGVALTALGLGGYVAGLWTPYPGRAFSLTALMIGLTLAATGRSTAPEGEP